MPNIELRESTLRVTAVGRALVVFSAMMATISGPRALATLTTLRIGTPPPGLKIRFFPAVYANLYFPRVTAVAILTFWIAFVFGSIALLQRRRIALIVLRITLGIALISFGVNASIEIWYSFIDDRWVLFQLIGSQALQWILVSSAIAVLFFLRSPAVRDEFFRRDVQPVPPSIQGGGKALVLWLIAIGLGLPVAFYLVGRWIYLQSHVLPTAGWTEVALWKVINLLGFLRYVEWIALLIAIAVASWTVRSRAARSGAPRDESNLLFFLQVTLIAYLTILGMTLVHDHLEIQVLSEVGAVIRSLLWPVALVALLGKRQTRMMGVALTGAFGLVWFLIVVGSGVAFGFLYTFIIPSDVVMVLLKSLQLVLIVIISLGGIVAAKRVLFSYAGRLPAVT